jgi:hypothetical protein
MTTEEAKIRYTEILHNVIDTTPEGKYFLPLSVERILEEQQTFIAYLQKRLDHE